MSNPSKRKGTEWESRCRDYLRDLYPLVERSPAWGAGDKGDLTGTGMFTVECKATKSIDLAGFVDEAVTEARNVGPLQLPVALVKRRNKSVHDGYAVMPMWAWKRLVQLIEESHA